MAFFKRNKPVATQIEGIPAIDEPAVFSRITDEDVRTAEHTMLEYKKGKENLEARIIDNEQWFKLRHWSRISPKSKNPGDPEPASAWLFNSIANKHADAMDSYPQPHVLPREEMDKQDAEMLSSILPVVLEQNGYEQVYSDLWWYKLKHGTSVTGVFWDPKKENGIGDIDIRCIDLLNLFWEPGITDIQKSQNLFHVELVDREVAERMYPQLRENGAGTVINVAKYIYDDTVDTSKKTMIVDWYYKRTAPTGRQILHYCKFCNGTVLYASENDPVYAERGYYDHGRYPFVFDSLFPVAGSPVGFGYLDICKSPQLYIDKLDQVILKHSIVGARNRYFIKGDGEVNEEEYANIENDFVHFQGSGDPRNSIFPIETQPLSDIYVSVKNLKIDELKETSGNRDFSQGGTSSGVTAASAIAALQEAGNKLSRDMNKGSYRSFRDVNTLIIELIRQFWTEPRWFRIIGKRGEMEFLQFSAQRIAAKPQGLHEYDVGFRLPVFDVTVTSQRANPFSTVAQNERAKELYGMGFFRPDLADQSLAALEMMDFEGIEEVRDRVMQNGTLFQQVQMLQQQMAKMAVIIDAQNGSTILQGMQQQLGGGVPRPGSTDGKSRSETDSIGEVYASARNSTVGEARKKAAESAVPR